MARGKGKARSSKFCDLGEKKCLEPTGKDIVWVYCEPCSKWFHCKCVHVDPKKASDDSFIFHCQSCKPLKKKEFDGMKSGLTTAMETLMKAHPTFSTPLVAKKCFSTKAKSNEYHVNDPEIPTTLRALCERINKKIETIDHFRYLSEALIDRLNDYLKPDMSSSIKSMGDDLKKMVDQFDISREEEEEEEVEEKPKPKQKSQAKSKAKKEPESAPTPTQPRRGGRVQQKRGDSNKENDEGPEKKETKPEKPQAGRRGGNRGKPEPPKEEPAKEEPKSQANSRRSARASKRRGEPEPEQNKVKERPKPEPPKALTKKDADMKKAKEPLAPNKKGNKNQTSSTEEEKMDVDHPPELEAPAATQKGKRKAAKAGQSEAKKPKLTEERDEPAKQVTAGGRGIKVPVGSPTKSGMIVTLPNAPIQLSPKTLDAAKVDGNKLLNIASLLPQSPNPRMQAAQIRPGGQLIQIRPGNVQIRPPGGTGNVLQVRPAAIRPAGAGGASGNLVTGGGPQFFKIVGGKPIQLSGISGAGSSTSTAAVLATSTAGSMSSPAQAGGPRIVYVRKPTPTSINNSGVTSSGITSTGAQVVASGSTSPSKMQSKIILVSNKNQLPGGGPVLTTAKAGAPGVVKLVSGPVSASSTNTTNISSIAPGILSTLRPVAINSTANSTSGPRAPPPVLLRAVMPKPVFQKSPGSVVPQLPSVPIPKSKLNDSRIKGPVTVAAGGNSLDPQMQAMLPKRPIPQQKVPISGSPPTKIIKKIITTGQVSGLSGNQGHPPTLILPSNPGSLLQGKQQITTISGPFVWKNSAHTNFKLSSRINFASFAKFREVSDSATSSKKDSKKGGKKNKTSSNDSNEGIHFTLATIITDDDSNEFTFRLNLKNDPKDNGNPFLELEAISRKPHNDHKWNLKVKTTPPTILVSGGCFATSDTKPANKSASVFRIPKQVSDLKFVDYELQIDKVVVLPQTPLPIAPKTGITTVIKGKK